MTHNTPAYLGLMESLTSADYNMLKNLPIPKEYKEKRMAYDKSFIHVIRVYSAKGLKEDIIPAFGRLGADLLAVQWLELKYRAELFVIVGSFISGVGEAVFVVAVVLFIIATIENEGEVDVFSMACLLLPFLRNIKYAGPLVGKLETLMRKKPKVPNSSSVNPFKIYNGKNVFSPLGEESVAMPELVDCIHGILKECRQLVYKLANHPQIKNIATTIQGEIERVIVKVNKSRNSVNPQKKLASSNKVTGSRLNINEANYYSGKSPTGDTPFNILREGDQIVGRYQIMQKPITNVGNPYANIYSHLW